MRIGFSIFPQRYLNRTEGALARSLERLSSGKRINSASDDVAGLSMSIGLDAQVRDTTQAIRNANDGMSMLSVADGAMNEMTNILQSMRELAVQAANGTLSSQERGAINNQVQNLMAEYDRIAHSTDFNGINLLDGTFGMRALQVGNTEASQISLALDDLRKEGTFEKTVGTGTFQARTSYAGGSSIMGLVSADVNGDDTLDLITAGADDHSVNVLLGNGDGTFRPKMSYYAGPSPYTLATADLNGDGILDLIAGSGGNSTVNILLGNGDGTFKPKVSYSGESMSIAVGDLNGDGIADLATTPAGSGTATVFLGNGDGTLKAAVAYGTFSGDNWGGVKTADLNGDGTLDLVVVDMDVGLVEIMFGNGDGTFKGAIEDSTFGLPYDITLADINGDGKTDIITGSQSNEVYVGLGNGDGTFKAGVGYSGRIGNIQIGDLNGDGLMDVAGSSDNTFRVFLGNGDGSLKAYSSYTGGTTVVGIALGDLNRDGVLDIATASQGDSKANALLQNTRAVTAISDMDLTTQAKAQGALAIIDRALTTVSSQRAGIGGLQGRLEHTVDSLYIGRENLSKAYSEIVDADIALETTELVRQQILQQAGIAVLAQSNVMQASVLELLRW